MTLSDKLSRYYPGAEWTLNGEDYSGLTWIGPGNKPTEQELADLDLPLAREQKLAQLADRRWEAETGGIVLGGVPIKTDRESTAKITAAYVQASANPSFTVRWKVDTGVFVTLDAATIIAIGDAVTAHVQACFDNEDVLTTAIRAAEDLVALDAIDIEAGWPA